MSDNIKDTELFFNFAQRAKGVDLNYYRISFVLRRLHKRMNILGVPGIRSYINFLKEKPDEWANFFDELSINVSKFFRDAEVFDIFQNYCLPILIEEKKRQKKKIIKVWSAGCSHGEEPYSIAMILDKVLSKEKSFRFMPRVWGTDVDRDAIEHAKKGIYDVSSFINVSYNMLKRYFVSVGGDKWEAKKSFKKMVFFREHNLFTRPPLFFVDTIFCRNVRIYFNHQQAQEVLFNLYKSLNEGGFLILGESEALPASLKSKVSRCKKPYKIFQKNKDKKEG